jgi:anti-sigma factor RsiW
MNCCEFREKYSDFADGLLPLGETSEADAHLAGCAGCRRFDAALRTGLDALRALPNVGLSHGFAHRLRHRLRGELAVRVPGVALWTGAVGTMLLVAAVGFIGWDLLEARAAHRGRPAWAVTAWNPSPTPLAATGSNPSYSNPPRSAVDPRFDPFHPLNSILVASETGPAVGGVQVRFDLPAVWGGP